MEQNHKSKKNLKNLNIKNQFNDQNFVHSTVKLWRHKRSQNRET